MIRLDKHCHQKCLLVNSVYNYKIPVVTRLVLLPLVLFKTTQAYNNIGSTAKIAPNAIDAKTMAIATLKPTVIERSSVLSET